MKKILFFCSALALVSSNLSQTMLGRFGSQLRQPTTSFGMRYFSLSPSIFSAGSFTPKLTGEQWSALAPSGLSKNQSMALRLLRHGKQAKQTAYEELKHVTERRIPPYQPKWKPNRKPSAITNQLIDEFSNFAKEADIAAAKTKLLEMLLKKSRVDKAVREYLATGGKPPW